MRPGFAHRSTPTGPLASPEVPGQTVAPPLRVYCRRNATGHLILRPVGELESPTVSLFRQAVADLGSGQVVVDMSQVPFVDSCGIGALIGAVRRVRALGGAIAIADVCRPVKRVLDLTGVDRVVRIADSVEEASAWLDASPSRPPGADQPVAI